MKKYTTPKKGYDTMGHAPNDPMRAALSDPKHWTNDASIFDFWLYFVPRSHDTVVSSRRGSPWYSLLYFLPPLFFYFIPFFFYILILQTT